MLVNAGVSPLVANIKQFCCCHSLETMSVTWNIESRGRFCPCASNVWWFFRISYRAHRQRNEIINAVLAHVFLSCFAPQCTHNIFFVVIRRKYAAYGIKFFQAKRCEQCHEQRCIKFYHDQRVIKIHIPISVCICRKSSILYHDLALIIVTLSVVTTDNEYFITALINIMLNFLDKSHHNRQGSAWLSVVGGDNNIVSPFPRHDNTCEWTFAVCTRL